jgi:nucleoside 2-deoxyribosyltransferase
MVNPDLKYELAKLREELGGPFFTEEENAAHREEVQEAMREYSHEIIQPRKQQHHIEKEQQSQETTEAKKLKKKLKNKKRK